MRRASPAPAVPRPVLRGAGAAVLRRPAGRRARWRPLGPCALLLLTIALPAAGPFLAQPALRGGGGRPPVGPAPKGSGGSRDEQPRLGLRGVVEAGNAAVTIHAWGPEATPCRMGFTSGSMLVLEEGGRLALDGLALDVERLRIQVPGHESRVVAMEGLERGGPVVLPRLPGGLRVRVLDPSGVARKVTEVRGKPLAGTTGTAFDWKGTAHREPLEIQPHSAGRFRVWIRAVGVDEWLVTDVELVAGKPAEIVLRR